MKHGKHGGTKMLAKLKRKQRARKRPVPKKVKDVEVYNPKPGKRKMIYKPGKNK